MTQVSEPARMGGATGRLTTGTTRPKKEWVAVPVPDSGIPREMVEAARDRGREEPQARSRRAEVLGAYRRDSLLRRVRENHVRQSQHESQERAHLHFDYYCCSSAVDTAPTFAPTPTGPERASWRLLYGTSSPVS